MRTDPEKDQLDKVVSALTEQWDCVQILVSRLDQRGTTQGRRWGSGNWYARKEMCREFIDQDQDINLAKAIASETKP